MTAHTTFASAPSVIVDGEKRHRRLVAIAAGLAIVFILGLTIYGADYYVLEPAQRPFSSKHHALMPSGAVGINLGFLGVLMLCGIFLYPLRKHWPWLQKKGNSKHWLDYHVVLGVAAPVVIAFHSSFKFRGLAGIAFWVMVAVTVSGFVGRYLYAQIPRLVAADERSLNVFRKVTVYMSARLEHQRLISPSDLKPLLRLPTPEQVASWPTLVALGYMVAFDLGRPIHVARLRMRFMGMEETLFSFGGLLPGRDPQLEWVISLAREQALLSKRIVFLTRAQQVFQLWHIIHKPFSYAFAILVILHILVAMLLGFI